MKTWMFLAVMSSVVIGSSCFAQDAADDEYEEVVIRRKKKKPANPVTTEDAAITAAAAPIAAVVVPTVVAVPVAVPTAVAVPAAAPAVPSAESAADEPPPPPIPPAADAAEPRRLVRYFCKAWKDKDYERLWWAMSEGYRQDVSLKKFKKLFVSDAETNGGLLDENILEAAKTKDGNEGVKVELIFKFPRAQHRFVMAVAERQPGGQFRLVASPFIPLDLDDL